MDRIAMQTAKSWIFFVLTIVVIGGICYGIYSAFEAVLASILTLDGKVAGAIIAACATIMVSVGIVVYNQRKTKAREIDESHRPQKIEMYKRFMEKAIVGVLRASKNKTFESKGFQKELQDLFFSFTGDVMVWGSPGVLRAYSAFRGSGEGDQRILLRLDELLREIRKDLGNSNWGLGQGDLIALFLTDPESLQKLDSEQNADRAL